MFKSINPLKSIHVIFFFLLIWLSSPLYGQINVDSLAHLDYQQIHGADLNDVWGYVDELGNEYAIVGTSKGTSIVDVTIPSSPIEVFWLPGTNSIWRDPCVYGDFAYITTEATDGLQIIDLSPLPQSHNLPSSIYTGPTNNPWQSAHTCFIDEKGVAYVFGANRGNGGAIMLDVKTTPMQPIEIGVFDNWYVHDGFARNDTLYLAHIIDGFFSLVDVKIKSNPILLGTKTTPNNFTHNIWPSDNGKYVFTTDEVSGAFIAAYDITNPSNIIEVDKTQSSPGAGIIPHNTHVKGDYTITSYYSDGIVIHDVTHPNNMVEVGNFDTYPGQSTGFDGCWGVYPFLPSGTILAADITRGLFILSPNYQKASYLEGLVTDQSSGNLLAGVKVKIIGNDQIELTASNGKYATGILGSGSFSVSFEKVGYYPKTEIVQLIQNQVVTLNTQLVPIPPFNFTIIVKEAQTGNLIPNAKIKIVHPLIVHQGITNGIGEESMTLYYQENYQIFIGKWGYITKCSEQVIDANVSSIEVLLEKGYFDNFEFDFGWSSTGTALTGKWERGKPFGTSTGSCVNQDDPLDCGDFAYVTGNRSTLHPDKDDVDKGTAILISPQMDLTSYSDPHINYSRGFYNYFGPFSVDDSLKIFLSNGSESVLIDCVAPPQLVPMQWVQKSIPVKGVITMNNKMQIVLKTSDLEPNANITEAALDFFHVTNYSTTNLDELENSVVVFPNPISDFIQINNVSLGEKIMVLDQKGRVIFDQLAAENSVKVPFDSLDNGIYFVRIGWKVFKVLKV